MVLSPSIIAEQEFNSDSECACDCILGAKISYNTRNNILIHTCKFYHGSKTNINQITVFIVLL